MSTVNVTANMDIGSKTRKQKKKDLSQNSTTYSGLLMIKVKHGLAIALNSVGLRKEKEKAKENQKEKEKEAKVDHGSNLSDRRARAKENITVISEKEKEKIKEKEREENEKNIKEKEKVKHTKPTAVNHSPRPKPGKNQKPIKINNNMSRIGLKTGGGQKDMPPQINNGARTVAGHIITIGLPSHTMTVFYPG